MANTATTLIWCCKTPEGWRRYPAVVNSNGRVNKGVVVVNGIQVAYPVGKFQIRYFVGPKTVYKNAGVDASAALAARDKMALQREAIVQAEIAEVKVEKPKQRLAMKPAVYGYIQNRVDSGYPEAARKSTVALDDLILLFPELKYVDEITPKLLVQYQAKLRTLGPERGKHPRQTREDIILNGKRPRPRCNNKPQTITNKHIRVMGFLRWAKVDVDSMEIPKPRFEKNIPTYFSPPVVKALIAATKDEYMRLVWDLLRWTGLREGEGTHLQWPDLDYHRKLVLVRSKPELGWKIKDHQERDIPMPAKLAAELKAWHRSHPGTSFVLGTEDDQPSWCWLKALKGVARAAGLNCGRCAPCLSHGECTLFRLHNWRRTYATRLSRKGIDLKTISKFLGHADVVTTAKYIVPMEAEEAYAEVDAALAEDD